MIKPQPQKTEIASRAYKHYVIGILLVVYTFNFVDRQILALLLQPIKEELQLSDTQLGLLSGLAFALFYATLGIPIARLADRYNRVTIISVSVALWSGMTALCGLATNFLHLILARIGVGVGEAGCTPPAHSLIADYFSRTDRSRALSIYMLGIPLGILVGYLIGGWVNQLYGWRIAFLTLGIPGVILAVIVKLTLREPLRGQVDGLQGNTEPVPPLLEVLKHIWRQHTFRHLVIANAILAFMNQGMNQWIPSFFIRTHGMTTGELGTWLALTHGVGGFIGIYLGGLLAGRYSTNNVHRQPRIIAIATALIMPFAIIAFISPNQYLALWLQLPIYLLTLFFLGPMFGMVQSLVGLRMRATASAIVLLVANLIGHGFGPPAVGILSDVLQPIFGQSALRDALLLISLLSLWSAWHFWRAGRTIHVDIHAVNAQQKKLNNRHESNDVAEFSESGENSQ